MNSMVVSPLKRQVSVADSFDTVVDMSTLSGIGRKNHIMVQILHF